MKRDTIQEFSHKDYGHFIDMVSGDSYVVNPRTGDVQFFRNGLPGCIPGDACGGFELVKDGADRHLLWMIYGTAPHRLPVGCTGNLSEAKKWVAITNSAITKARRTPPKTKLVIPRAKPAAAKRRTASATRKRSKAAA